MDYKYIEQLLERYFQCETTLKEEEILRSFFTQEEEPLGEAFDETILKLIEEGEPVKARVVTITQRLKPLFRAAAVVAIVLTIGNAAQTPWDRGWDNPREEYAKYLEQQRLDSLNRLGPVQAENLLEDSTNTQVKELPKY